MRNIKLRPMISIAIVVLICLLSNLFCSSPVGGGSEAGNAKLIGKIVDSLGNSVNNAFVTARLSDYDPVKDSRTTYSGFDTTGPDGMYHFSVQMGKNYTIGALSSTLSKQALVIGVGVIDNENSIPACTLKVSGTIKIQLPDSADKTNGYLYIPGTSMFTLLNNSSNFVVLDNVPAVLLPSVLYSSIQMQSSSTIRNAVQVQSNDTINVYNPSWKYSRDFLLNTTTSGANISGNVTNFPVCIRLTSSNFSFEQARSDGSDLRFTKIDNTPLSYEIERWDPVNRQAEIWVKIDTVHGNDSAHSYSMYWGNAVAASESKGSDVFGTSSEFQGVWHLAGKGTETVFDATINQYHGTPYNMNATSAVAGIIGNARDFDGTASYILMPNTASGNLDMPQNGFYSISLWAYADTIDSAWHVIAGKGHEQYYLKFKCFPDGNANWEFVEFQDQQGWSYTEGLIPPSPGQKQWVNLTGVRSGTSQLLYVNGVMVDSTQDMQVGNFSWNSGDDFILGRYAREVTIPSAEGWCYFNGKIDEVRVMNVALSPDWIKLSYMNQKRDDALVKFK